MPPLSLSFEPLQSKFIPALCELLIARFRRQFKLCQTISDVPLKAFFEKQLEA